MRFAWENLNKYRKLSKNVHLSPITGKPPIDVVEISMTVNIIMLTQQPKIKG